MSIGLVNFYRYGKRMSSWKGIKIGKQINVNLKGRHITEVEGKL